MPASAFGGCSSGRLSMPGRDHLRGLVSLIFNSRCAVATGRVVLVTEETVYHHRRAERVHDNSLDLKGVAALTEE